MHAILISSENLPEIRQSEVLTEEELNHLDPYIRNAKNWYLISGYVPRLGAPENWGILPQYMFEKKFEYDPEKIQTTWDQIVRK